MSVANLPSWPVIGPLHPNRFMGGEGSDFGEFRSGMGIDGLACVRDGELHLLSVIAATPGIGQFREFIRQCKEAYPSIRVWCITNDAVRPMLSRYGFTHGHDVDKYGDMQEVWDWRKIDGNAPPRDN